MKMKPIVRPIFQKPNGYWWAYSMVRPGYFHSLGTKSRVTAQAKYDQSLREIRQYLAEEKRRDRP